MVQRRISEPSTGVPKFRELVVTVTCEDVLGFKNSTGPFSPPPSSIWGSQHHGVFFFREFHFQVFGVLNETSWQVLKEISTFNVLGIRSNDVNASTLPLVFLCFWLPKCVVDDGNLLTKMPLFPLSRGSLWEDCHKGSQRTLPIKKTNIHMCHLVRVYVVGIIAWK